MHSGFGALEVSPCLTAAFNSSQRGDSDWSDNFERQSVAPILHSGSAGDGVVQTS